MFGYFYAGLITLSFSILSFYPLFEEIDKTAGVLFLIASVIFFVLFSKASGKYSSKKQSLFNGLFLTSIAALFEGAGLFLYVEIFSRWSSLPFLAPLYKAVFSLMGVPNSSLNGSVHLYGVAEYIHTFSPNAGNLGLVYFLMTLLGSLSLFFMVKKNHKKSLSIILWASLTQLFYLFIRSAFIIGMILQQNVDQTSDWFYLAFFWHPIFSLISFIPWVIMTALLFKKAPDMSNPVENIKIIKPNLISAACLGMATIILMLTIFWIPSGKAKNGRVLINEYNSEWTKSDKAIDENWYGTASTYNYYTMRMYLNAYYDVEINEQPFEELDMEQYDVIIIKIPTRPFSQESIQKIEAYVKQGGGLWVIGDHTNVFGSSTYLNPLLSVFGIQLNIDAAYQNSHGSFNKMYLSSPLKHPILKSVPVFLFATPCTMKIDNPNMRLVVPGETTKAYAASYSQKNFFPDTKPDMNINFGTNPLLTAGEFGSGRIAVFSDSTCFSNFFFYLPGKAELARSIVTWLNHSNALSLVKPLLIILFVLFVSAFVFLYRKTQQKTLFWPAAFILIGYLSAVPLLSLLNSQSIPTEKRPLKNVSFLAPYSGIYLPYSEWKDGAPNDFNTLYIWGQRVGARTRYVESVEEAANNSRAIYMILPSKKFTEKDLEKLNSYMENGGQIFLMDDARNDSSANQFLIKYGLYLKRKDTGEGRIISEADTEGYYNHLPVGTVQGDAEILMNWAGFNGEFEPVLVRKKVGSGSLYVFGGVNKFATPVFGYDAVQPEGELQKVNDLMLHLYRLAIE